MSYTAPAWVDHMESHRWFMLHGTHNVFSPEHLQTGISDNALIIHQRREVLECT